jgi:hypothetical protein
MRRLLLTGLLLGLALRAAAAAPAAVDLGEGLSYVRVGQVEALPAASGPLVIDLRRATAADEAMAEAFVASLRTAGPVRFVLVSRQTSPALLARLGQRAPAVLLLGTGVAEPALDVALTVTAEEDGRAYDAHEQGTALAALIQPPLRKPRRDEAAIMRSRTNGNGDGNAAESPTAAEPAAGEPAEPLLVDAVLQRAVHLHRGLKALGRL